MDGRYSFVNEYYKKSFAHITDDFMGKKFDISLHSDDIETYVAVVTQCLSDNGRVVALDLRKPDSQGGIFHTHWNFFAEKNESGNVHEIGCVGYDTTTSTNTQQKLESILNSTDESFYMLDKNMRILSFNLGAKNATKLFYGIDLYEGYDFSRQLLDGTVEEFTTQFNEALAGKKSVVENKLTFPTGREVWFRLSMAPAHDASLHIFGVIVSFVNIDLQKRSQQKLKEIAWLQSHNIRSPLTNILALTNLLSIENASSDNADIIKMLKTSAEELDAVVKDVVAKTAK